MSEAFTPGPWSWAGEDYRGGWGWQLLVGPNGEGILCGEGKDGPYRHLRGFMPIDPEFCKTGMEADEECAPCVHVQKADARLIASAPELYGALKVFVDEYVAMVNSGDCGFWNPEEEEKVRAARAALAKAEGKA